jgi:hypothetical protein
LDVADKFVRSLLPNLATTPGVDVMITILCDFRHFSAKKIVCFFLKNQCYDQFFA